MIKASFARMLIATTLVLVLLLLIISGYSSYQNDEVLPAEVRHHRHRRQSPGIRSPVLNNDEGVLSNELESQMVLPSARQDGDDDDDGDDGDDACQTRLKNVVPKSLMIRRLVRCDKGKEASKRISKSVPLVHVLHMADSPPRVNLSRRFLADASSRLTPTVDAAGGHASTLDAATSSDSATSDQSAFHIDYSGPKTHPPIHNFHVDYNSPKTHTPINN